MVLAPDIMLGIFLHDPNTLDVARMPMRLIGGTMVVEAISIVLMHSLLGAGDVHRVMRISILCQRFYFLNLAKLIGPVLGYGLIGVWLLNISYRAIVACVFALLWQRGKWSSIKV